MRTNELGRWLVGVGAVVAVAGAVRAEPSFYLARIAPVMERHCVVCHGPEKQKAGLRLDSFAHIMKGAESGVMVKPGDAAGSELLRRVRLPKDDEEVMPSDGKPLLAIEEIKLIELWIAAGASDTAPLSAFPEAPAPKPRRSAVVALAPDWRPLAKEIAAAERAAGVRLVPRSQVPTDGLILRTASAPKRCDDAALAKLAPVAALIVEAELARTRVTDAGLASVGAWTNLRRIDLSAVPVTSAGVAALAKLEQLEAVNLTNTKVDGSGVATLKARPQVQQVWVFGSPAGE
jgi:hypothetical protein